MKKKGFTLIELLAVIVILAIILLIATPIVLSVIDYVRKAGFRASTHSIVRAAELNHLDNIRNDVNMSVQSNGCSASGYEIYTYKDGQIQGDKILQIRGQKPKEGSVSINAKGEVAFALHNGKWCARKSYDGSDIILTDDQMSNCVLPSNGDGFIDIQSIEDYVVALSCSGEVFMGKYDNIHNLDKVENLPKIKKIYEDTYFLGENSELHMIYDSWNDDLGEYEKKKMVVNNVKDVTIGPRRETAYILLNNGQVMARGDNYDNKIGTGSSDIEYYEEPILIPNLTNVKKITKGYDSTMALLNDGTVKIWGYNLGGAEYDEIVYNDKVAYTPKILPNISNAIDIVTAANVNFIILSDGSVKVWGDNNYFPLGLNEYTIIETPITHPNLSNIKEIKVYYEYQEGSSVLAIKTNGDVLLWGNANWSNSWENYNLLPTLLPVSSIVSASLTNKKIILLDNNKKLWVLGDNNNKSLCVDSLGSSESSIPTVLQCVSNSANAEEGIECVKKVTLIDKHKEYNKHLGCLRMMLQCEEDVEGEGCSECGEVISEDLDGFLQVLSEYDINGNHIVVSENESDNYICPFEFTSPQKLPHLNSIEKITFDPFTNNGDDLNVGIINNQLFAWGTYYRAA